MLLKLDEEKKPLILSVLNLCNELTPGLKK
jgi:hypothetical protein